MEDGFGQSLIDDLRFRYRFAKCLRRQTEWRIPEHDDARALEADPRFARFADTAIAVAEVDGRHWLVLERDWHGFPDPPRYVFFAWAGDNIWAAADFHRWPQAWGAEPT